MIRRAKKSGKIQAVVIVIFGSFLFFAACSDKADFKAGLITLSVNGTIKVTPGSEVSHTFIIVQKHHRTLIESSSGRLYRISASIVHPDETGRYKVQLNSEVDRVDLTIVATGHRSSQGSFRRTIGIGSYEFNVDLEEDPNWRNNYFFLIKPAFSEYITEERYRMEQFDQLFLGSWFNEIEAEFK